MIGPIQSRLLRSHFIPSRRQEGPNRLLVVLHGRGDSIEGFLFLPGVLNIDTMAYLLLQAPDPSPPGYSWYDLPPDQAPGIIRSRKILFDLVAELEQTHDMQPDQIGFLGFSQGCLMCLDLVLRYPRRLGPVVGISGYVGLIEEFPTALSPVASTQKVLVTHGRQDGVLPFEQTESQVRMIQEMGVPLRWSPYMKDHTVDLEDEITEIRTFLQA